jgi:hypothetical protein
MYEGDKTRDASDKVRGFLFQDYIAIKCLLKDDVEYVCSEYLEDVDVFYKDGRFEFIQVKYYPKTTPDMEEISTDLYYQYLRLKMLNSGLEALPRLYIHRRQKVNQPTLAEMKGHIGAGAGLPDTPAYPADPKKWLKGNVYSRKKKGEQKKVLFDHAASEETLQGFVDDFSIVKQKNIIEYREDLMAALGQVYSIPDDEGDEDHWQRILLGLAISYIQRRYTLVNPSFEDLRVSKAEFDAYMTASVETKTEETIISYLVGECTERFESIIYHNDLSDFQKNILSQIYRKTLRWICNLAKDAEGQYRLVNTLSKKSAKSVSTFKTKSVESRLTVIAGCQDGIHTFFGYLWKIMLNICQDELDENADMDTNSKLFDPLSYVDQNVKDYICLHFPEEGDIKHSVILPEALSEFGGVKRRIAERMLAMDPRPEKWYFSNRDIENGENIYNYRTLDVDPRATVIDLGKESFYIECMECIGIDEGKWCNREHCCDCIFSLNCVKEGNES